MRNESWVWPEVGDAGTSGAGAVPLTSEQMMGQQQQQQQQQQKQKRKESKKRHHQRFSLFYRQTLKGLKTQPSKDMA